MVDHGRRKLIEGCGHLVGFESSLSFNHGIIEGALIMELLKEVDKTLNKTHFDDGPLRRPTNSPFYITW